MNIKEVKFNQEAKEPLIKGIKTVCDAVATTMGYRGRTVLIESNGGLPIVTKDGVSVADAIFLEDASESLGAEFTSGYAKSLDYLIVGSVKGSSKEDKAKKDGVKIMTENEFKEAIS
jgi:chaperonin GroEL